MCDNLDYQEKGLIEIIRAFKFLRYEGYHEKEISIGGRSNPSIIYYNNRINRCVKILGNESPSWTVEILRKKIISLKKEFVLLDISDYYQVFGSTIIKGRTYTLKSQAQFVQQFFMPLIKGELWINELIDQKLNSIDKEAAAR